MIVRNTYIVQMVANVFHTSSDSVDSIPDPLSQRYKTNPNQKPTVLST